MNVSELKAPCQKVILLSRGGDNGKIFRVLPVKSYWSEVAALLIFKQGAR